MPIEDNYFWKAHDYWKMRAEIAERRVHRLEDLLETPENQRDADMLIEYADDCYTWYTSYQNAMDLHVQESFDALIEASDRCFYLDDMLQRLKQVTTTHFSRAI